MKAQTKEELFKFYPWQRVIKVIGNSMTKLTQTEISDRLGLTTHCVYIILYELERQGLIVRIQNKFKVEVSLTSRGRMVWKSFSDIEMTIGKRI